MVPIWILDIQLSVSYVKSLFTIHDIAIHKAC